jgi:ABC-type Fe3+/spermidine/putrescine transport system ATPase subunit
VSRGTSRGEDYYTPKRQPKLLAKYVRLRKNLREELHSSLNVIQFQMEVTVTVVTRAQSEAHAVRGEDRET